MTKDILKPLTLYKTELNLFNDKCQIAENACIELFPINFMIREVSYM